MAHKIKYKKSGVLHALKITTIKLQIQNLNLSLPPRHQAALDRAEASLYSLSELNGPRPGRRNRPYLMGLSILDTVRKAARLAV